MPHSFSNISSRGFRLRIDQYNQGLPPEAPTVIYLHGFKGFKDWGFVPHIGKSFEQAGIQLVAFNFSHNGIGDQLTEFTELERFRDNTFSLELEEAQEVIAWITSGELLGQPPRKQVGLLGHSRGGGIALLAGCGNPLVGRICTWAAVSTFKRYPETVIERWRQQGFLEVTNARTGQVMQLGWNLHADLLEHLHGKLNIRKAVSAMTQPLCIIHGTQDEAVPLEDALALMEWAENTSAELHTIEGAGHTFGARHPFEGTTSPLEEALAHTLAFFRQG
jgi:pimeloyl-ACP methyl ester carboxylesterase